MAIKINEAPIQPSIDSMVRMLNHWDSRQVSKAELVKLEEHVLRTLDFDFGWTTPMHFIPRFERLFGLGRIS